MIFDDRVKYEILLRINASYVNDNFDLNNTLNLKKLNLTESELGLYLEELIDSGYINDLKIKTLHDGNFITTGVKPNVSIHGKYFCDNFK